MHRAFADLGELEKHVIDTTDQTIDETAGAVREQARPLS
jgi:hypothetical protein